MHFKAFFESSTRGKNGYVFPMILFATLAVGLFIATLTQFQASTRLKYQHLNSYQTAFNIAYSALVEVLADIQSRQWSNRIFKGAAKSSSAGLFGGTYDLWVEDYDTSKYLFNVKVRVNYRNKNHLFYWRMKYNPNLLDFTNLFVPIYFGEFDEEKSDPVDLDDLDKIVDEKLKRQEENQDKAREIVRKIKPAPTIEDALKVIGIDKDNIKGGDTERVPEPQIDVTGDDLPLKELQQLIEDVDPETSYVVKDLQFGADVAELDAEQKLLLDTLVELLDERPDLKIELRGHTTGLVGTAETNQIFSVRRAQSVSDYLEESGISSERITVKGYGRTRPIASNATEEGQAKNRRVEFVLLEESDS
ncbi:MAG: hypothetical protein PWR01_4271 [Clostridiales bacterium]|jgi:outer membrane protein OmpA-like peptidoglycan-associated protein|nr:hypothetical protein [Clostridiales bacterium]MDN5283198.1 hypothetical protein [Candidatus Ozemobacter sp.]